VEASSFWNDSSPIAMGLDGYRVFYEGVRDGRTHERAAWCPNDAMFATFASLAAAAAAAPARRSSWLGCALMLVAGALLIGGLSYLVWS
jgi:hypothetical protein